MRLRTMICPNGCMYPDSPRKRMRMIIRSTLNDKNKIWNSDTVIDWLCPICGKTVPVSSDDLRRTSKKAICSNIADKREKYGLKGNDEQ